MNKFALIIAVAALCAMPWWPPSAASQAHQAKPIVLPMNGSYLSTTYLAVLEKTRSHKKASDTASPQGFTVSRDKRGLVMDLVVIWHEGTSAISIQIIQR